MPHLENANVHFDTKVRLLTEAAMRSSLEQKRSIILLVREIIGRSPKSVKFQSTIELMSRIFPEQAVSFFQKITQSRIELDGLPFSEEDLSFTKKISHGYVNEVFLLESQREDLNSMVLKLNYIDHGNSEELAELTSLQNKEYEKICEIYEELPELIPWQSSLVIKSPQTKKPVIATLQEFQGGTLKDVFEDYSQNELLTLLDDHEELQVSFGKFAEITLSHWKEEREIIDLIGKKNLNIVENDGVFTLLFIDPEGIFHEGDRDEETQVKYDERIAFLSDVNNEISSEHA